MANPTLEDRKVASIDPALRGGGSLVSGVSADGQGVLAVMIDPTTGGLRVSSVGGQLEGGIATAPNYYRSSALEASARLLSQPGRLHRVDLLVPSAPGLRYLHIFDADQTVDLASLAGAVPDWRAALPDGAVQVTVGLDPGFPCTKGCVVALSTTAATFTTAGAICLFHSYQQVDVGIDE